MGKIRHRSDGDSYSCKNRINTNISADCADVAAQIFTAELHRARVFLAPTAVVSYGDKTKDRIPGYKVVDMGGGGREVGDIEILWVCYEAPSEQ